MHDTVKLCMYDTASLTLHRYYHLIENGLPSEMVAPLSDEWIENAQKLIPEHLLSNFNDVRIYYGGIITMILLRRN